MSKNDMVRFLIIGDLHGVKPVIHVDLKNIDAIIATGDFCGDDIRKYYIELFKEIKKTGDESLSLEDFCPKWKQKFYEFKSIRKGRMVLKYLNSFEKPIFLVPGNWEPTSHENGKVKGINSWDKLKKGLINLNDVENKKIVFKGITIIGHGSTSAPEPFKLLPNFFFNSVEEFTIYDSQVKYFKNIYKNLETYFKTSNGSIILLTHNVPYKTKLDKINSPNSYVHNKHYGSIIVRKLIDEYQPVLCVGGHIHEGYGKTRLKKTLCINAGFGGDVNTIVEVDVSDGKIIKTEFLGKNKKNI